MLIASALTKSYGGVRALSDGNLTVRPGTVHALLGENGAGKSTMIKVITGVVAPDGGSLTLDGRDIAFSSTRDAAAHGVSVVSQELSLFPDLDLLANLFPYRQPRRAGLVDRRAMATEAQPLMDLLGLEATPDTIVGELSLAEQQLVEITRALLQKPKVLILDEPTSALDAGAAARLLDVLDRLRSNGTSVLLVSHMLEEVKAISDEVTILRDGRTVLAGADMAGLDIPQLVDAMLGEHRAALQGEVAQADVDSIDIEQVESPIGRGLVIEGVSVAARLDDVTLSARPGQVLGLAGLAGSGHETVLQVLSGHVTPTTGAVVLPSGETLRPGVRTAIASGVALVTGDRRRSGLLLDKSVAENIGTVRAISMTGAWRWVNARTLRERALERAEQLAIRPLDAVDRPAGQLSGGNQQKVVLAKWMEIEPDVLLLDDPTRGVDIGAKAEAHAIIRALAASGRVVIFATTDIEELADLSDRVIVFHRGRTVGDLTGEELTPYRLLQAINATTDERPAA